MSAPETTSKGRPSLLSETAPGTPDGSSRILASLEGRVSAQQRPRRRSKKPFGIAALVAVVGIGAFGAWQWQRAERTDAGRPLAAAVANADKAHGAAGASAAAVANASGAAALARVAQDGQSGASAPKAAVIVADNTPASAPNAAGTDPLSRALANGASSAEKSAAPAGASGAAVSGKSSAAAKPAAHSERENAKNRRAEKLAAERASKHRSAGKHDPDVDLLAVLVARTKPYDAHAPQAASGAGAKGAAAKARPVSLAAQIKQCDKSNFFEAQLCRWRACSDHWGKDPACPSANASPQTR